jgi:hypothetical protein
MIICVELTITEQYLYPGYCHQHLKAMKTTAKMIAIIFLLGAGMWLAPQRAQAHYFGITYQVFYDDLSPYGNWVFTPDYGYVWVPDAGPDFTPYSTSGYWTYSVYGWTWVSYYPWGWAPFHYGRWYYDNWYGWAWVPGNEWGPGWVAWRQCDGYYGWAPMTPGFNVTVNVNWNLIPTFSWIFVPRIHFGFPGMEHYYVNRHGDDWYYRRSSFMGGMSMDRDTRVRYFAGPEAREVSKITGREIRPMEVRRDEHPGQAVRDGKMDIYRPEVSKTDTRTRVSPAPEKYSVYKERPRKTEPVVRNERPVDNSRKQYTSPPREQQVTPKQERVTPNQERNQTPKQERINPSQERKTAPKYQSNNTKVERQSAPPARQNTTVKHDAKPEVKQNNGQKIEVRKNQSEVHNRR